MVAPEYDAVIAGGGLSGLSLAAHLAATGWRDRRLLVVDDDSAKPSALCWGSWSARPGLLDPAVSRSYRQVRVAAAGRRRVVSLDPYRYRLVRRPDLYRLVTARMADCPEFELRSGRVQDVLDRGDFAEVIVDGAPITCSWAFDSVTAGPVRAAPDAQLAFTGWEIRCARAAFDPDTPTLFDFRAPPAGTTSFIYILPDDPHRALIELTEFVPRGVRPTSARDHGVALATYLGDILRIGGYETLRTESAVLPLRAHPGPREPGRVTRIGARGGLIKASTGYAYERVQRDSAAIARSLERHGNPFHRPSSSGRHRVLDALLLDVLQRDSAQLELAFARLFAGNPAQRVLRFLDEDSDLGDELRLIASMPPAPYLRAAAARIARQVRRRVRRRAAWRVPPPPGRRRGAAAPG